MNSPAILAGRHAKLIPVADLRISGRGGVEPGWLGYVGSPTILGVPGG
jgi:hypothetical protein